MKELVVSSESPHPVAIRFHREFDRATYAAHFVAYDYTKRQAYILRRLVFEELASGERFPEPALTFGDHDINGLQEMMNDLWRAGIRPTMLDTDALANERDYLRGLVKVILPAALRKADT